MSAEIEFLCATSHERRDAGTVTIVDGRWAYCGEGGDEDHDWRRIMPIAMGELLTLSSHGRRVLLEHTAAK